MGALCVLAAIFVSLQPAAPLRPLQHVSVPPIFETTPNATFCGSDLVPTHLVHTDQPNAFWHQFQIDQAIREAPCADSTKDRLIAALGRSRECRDTENDKVFAELPQLSADKLQLKIYENTYMTVNPTDMTAPIMAGVRKKTLPPYDHREFLAIKVEDVANGKVETQVFNRMFDRAKSGEENDSFQVTWTTGPGPIIQGKNLYTLTENDVETLGYLFNGHAVKGRGGHSYRLAC